MNLQKKHKDETNTSKEENMVSSFKSSYESNIFELLVGLNDLYFLMHNIFVDLKFFFVICIH